MATDSEQIHDSDDKLNPALDVDLDEIDDKEFDIPRVDKPPTLESILNAPDEDLPIADNCFVDATLQVSEWHAHLGVHRLLTVAREHNSLKARYVLPWC